MKRLLAIIAIIGLVSIVTADPVLFGPYENLGTTTDDDSLYAAISYVDGQDLIILNKAILAANGNDTGPGGVNNSLVSGPNSATVNNVAVFSTTTGRVIADGGQTIAQIIAASGGVNNTLETKLNASQYFDTKLNTSQNYVRGPGSSTDQDIALFSGTGGHLISDSGILISSLNGVNNSLETKLNASQNYDTKLNTSQNYVRGPGTSTDQNVPVFSGTGGHLLSDSGVSISSLGSVNNSLETKLNASQYFDTKLNTSQQFYLRSTAAIDYNAHVLNDSVIKNAASIMDTANHTASDNDAALMDLNNRTIVHLMGNFTILAQSLIPDNTNGARVSAPNTTGTASGPINVISMDFDAPAGAAGINATVGVILPAAYNGTAQLLETPYWYSSGGTGSVVWDFAWYCPGTATINGAWTNNQSVSVTSSSINVIYSGVTGATTASGTPAASTFCWLHVRRLGGTQTSTAHLLGVQVGYPIT